MLKNIDPLITPEVFEALYLMGHGDQLVIADANYQADTAARHSSVGKLLRMDGGDSARAIRAVLSVFPLDSSFVDYPIEYMEPDARPEVLPHPIQEVQREVEVSLGKPLKLSPISRGEFYERAKRVYAVVITGEMRAWGNFILRKGLALSPDEPAMNGTSHISNYRWK